MVERALVFALTLTTAGVWSSPETAAAPFTQGQSAWQNTDSGRSFADIPSRRLAHHVSTPRRHRSTPIAAGVAARRSS